VKEINAAGLSTISTGNRTFIYKTGLFFLVASICVVFLGPIGSRIGWWDYYFAVLLYWKKAKQTYPPIQDISTDLFEPPEFWYAPNVKVYNPLAIADMQMEAYPDVEPAVLTLPFDQAFNLIHEIVQDTGWEILAVEPENGRIEATDTTFWFGFSDDVVIRVTREGESSTIDIRSTSRFGSGGDGGTNAKRILRLLKELDRRISVT
jgi:uncharacterized protein (DUF1499 family)